PQRPIVSTVTGTWLKDEQAMDVLYWAEHIKHTVRFADALETINSLDNSLFIEVGPGKVTSTFARQALAQGHHSIVTSLERISGQPEIVSLLTAVGKVWLHGVEPDWKSFYGGKESRKITIPNYAFDKKRCWVDPRSFRSTPAISTGLSKEKEIPVDKNSRLTNLDSHAIRLKEIVRGILNISGIRAYDLSKSFLEIGCDSLLLTQIALNLRKEFDLPITFRKLSEEYVSPLLLVEYLEKNLPKD